MKQKITGSLLLLMILIFANDLLAQTGTLKGVVKDETGTPAFDVTVVIPSVKKGAVTGFEGEYEIANIPPGTYKIYFKGVGFRLDSLTGVEIKANEVTVIDKNIYSDGAIVIEIIKEKDQGSVVTQIEQVKKEEKAIVQVGGEQIRQGSDRNAADALRRLPGVTLIDNRFIMVRGLTERYNTVWLNDASAPSAEPDKKAFSFDIIQSSLIDKIQVYKTPAPDLPGDFAGGMAKIYTRASAPKKDFQISLQGSYRPGSTFNTFDYSNTEKLDFLGFGSKARSLPQGFPDYVNKVDDNFSDVSRSLKNTWGIHQKKALPDFRFNTYYANKFVIGKNWTLGNTSAINYSNQNTQFTIKRFDWDSTTQTSGTIDQQSTNLVNLGIVENLSLIFNSKHSIQFRNLFNQTGRSQTTIRDDDMPQNANMRSYALGYQSRQVFTSQLSGVHGVDTLTEYRWTAGFSYSNRKDPDFRRIRYVKERTEDDSLYFAQVPPGGAVDINNGGRFFSNLYERTYSYNHNFKQRIKIKNYKFDLNLGNFAEYKERFFKARLLGYVLLNPTPVTFGYKYLPIDQIFDHAYVGVNGGFRLDESTRPDESYNAQNKLLASYASVSLPIANRIKLLTGARAEYNIQSLQSYISTEKVEPTVKTFFVLPSANLTYKFNENSLLRLSAGKTLNRPEFREWSPFGFYDFDFNALTFGSLFPTTISNGQTLKVAEIMNYDMRYELYPSPLEMFHVGLFYKSFKNPIQQVILISSGDGRQFTFTNAGSAYSAGIEIDVRKNLGFIDSLIGTRFMKHLNIVGNASIIKSEVKNDKLVNQQSTNPLPGQSPYVFNIGMYYQAGADSNALQFSLLYNVFGPRVFFVGTIDYPNIGEMPRNTIDLTINKTLSKRIGIVLSIQDILNQPVLLVQDTNLNGKFERNESQDKPFMKYRRGSYFTAGIRIKL